MENSQPEMRTQEMAQAALFTETPHDMTARTGEDVEMACSFRGSGSPSYSLEIQWWYVRSHRDWTDKQAWASNQVVKVVGSNISHKLRLSRVKPTDEGTYECRVIDFSDGKAGSVSEAPPEWALAAGAPPVRLPSLCRPQVVKVVGSNISHKLRLSRVKPTDEGTYECRVIDFSDGKARHHKVKAYLRVQPGENSVLHLPEAPRPPRRPPSLARSCGSARWTRKRAA
uniref:V-set and transmembrane domain-containing protein 2-like protein n=1 Tax=Camelus bactrianus TaxID=9837 RepID=A0A9W3HM41_CAMBA